MEESHSYYDFQNIINTSNKKINERVDLMEVYFNQMLKDNTFFRKQLKELEEKLNDSGYYINWYMKLPLYKLIWYKICKKNFYEIYSNQN